MVVLAAVFDAAPSRKEVVVAEVGAAAAFVGFVLVFLGVLVSTYQTLLGQVSTGTLEKFKAASWVSLAVALVGCASLVVSIAWLVTGGGKPFYVATLIMFFAEVAAVVVAAVFTSWRVLLR